ncbi:siderophore-interacting protein, partial [Glutamicibacter creatinolyticus]
SAELRPSAEHCPTLAFETEVVRAENISHSFRRITLAGPDLEHFGTNSHPLDMRIKLLLATNKAGMLPQELAAMRPAGLT